MNKTGFQNHDYYGISLALGSAFLFGISAPLAKLIVDDAGPWLLAGMLYLGAGIGLALFQFFRKSLGIINTEAPIRKKDIPWLALVVLSGGVVGPVLLMYGLAHTGASTASLLLNVEGLATMGIAWIVFKEYVDRRLLLGAFSILAGAVLLSWQDGGSFNFDTGAILVICACFAWGIDNNLTRKLSSADPVNIVTIKGLAAGTVNIILALSQNAAISAPGVIAGAALIGFFCYGVSIVMFVLGLRFLGTARCGAYYSTAPFIGAALSVLLFSETLSIQFMAAGVLMAVGVWLHVTEKHSHEHVHEAVTHEHAHVHDEHHQHEHGPDDPAGEPHSHAHAHEPLRHSHPHYPDIHHRHRH
jgi:drug/metabolite transporter (DMT)-like permease